MAADTRFSSYYPVASVAELALNHLDLSNETPSFRKSQTKSLLAQVSRQLFVQSRRLIPPVTSESTRFIDTRVFDPLDDVYFHELQPFILRTMGETVPEVSVKWFLQYAIPRFSPGHDLDDTEVHYAADLNVLDKVMLKLRKSAVKGRWKWYKKDPVQMGQGGDKVFSHMKDLSDAVLAAGKEVMPMLDVTAQLECQPRRIGNSGSDNSNFKRDANQLLVQEQSTGVGPKGK
ncbi:hypothetical protein Moror_8726, partial [Moniliophthora roreri MCA 2997]